MQPPWPPGSSDASAGASASRKMPAIGTVQTLAAQVQPLAAHVTQLELALTTREWWLLGRAFREAQVLSEVASLLAVVRAELDGMLAQLGAPPTASGADDEAAVADDEHHLLNDPGWVQARREEAVALVGHAASTLPGLLQYTQQLLLVAGRAVGTSLPLDGLEIARDRLREACEAVEPGPS